MTLDEFRTAYLDPLPKGQEFEIWGYPKGGEVIQFLQHASAAAVGIIRMRSQKTINGMSTQRCHKVMSSKSGALWLLTTDDGARFLYFRDGAKHLIIAGASEKVKERKFQIEIDRADQLRTEYLQLKEGKVK